MIWWGCAPQVTGRTWGARGITPVVRRTGNRFSANAMSAISTEGRMHFMVFTESFKAKAMYRFLDRLAGHVDRKVHLIVDRHSAHRSKTARTWLADHKDGIELHFLPSYSPEPNPDELVNAALERSPPHTHPACPYSTHRLRLLGREGCLRQIGNGQVRLTLYRHAMHSLTRRLRDGADFPRTIGADGPAAWPLSSTSAMKAQIRGPRRIEASGDPHPRPL
ncbi:transposase [Streptomyces sp. NPDC000609]|uniref:transposase n=1 Tax=Streptomyces sp. NPDC000609 TaxID=3160957 RepID=UPI00339203E1